MPKPQDINATIGVIDPVNDAVGANHNFSQLLVPELGDDSPQFGEVRQSFCLGYQKLTETESTFWRVKRDIAHDIA